MRGMHGSNNCSVLISIEKPPQSIFEEEIEKKDSQLVGRKVWSYQ